MPSAFVVVCVNPRKACWKPAVSPGLLWVARRNLCFSSLLLTQGYRSLGCLIGAGGGVAVVLSCEPFCGVLPTTNASLALSQCIMSGNSVVRSDAGPAIGTMVLNVGAGALLMLSSDAAGVSVLSHGAIRVTESSFNGNLAYGTAVGVVFGIFDCRL
jgi:hypothetical protein